MKGGQSVTKGSRGHASAGALSELVLAVILRQPAPSRSASNIVSLGTPHPIDTAVAGGQVTLQWDRSWSDRRDRFERSPEKSSAPDSC